MATTFRPLIESWRHFGNISATLGRSSGNLLSYGNPSSTLASAPQARSTRITPVVFGPPTHSVSSLSTCLPRFPASSVAETSRLHLLGRLPQLSVKHFSRRAYRTIIMQIVGHLHTLRLVTPLHHAAVYVLPLRPFLFSSVDESPPSLLPSSALSRRLFVVSSLQHRLVARPASRRARGHEPRRFSDLAGSMQAVRGLSEGRWLSNFVLPSVIAPSGWGARSLPCLESCLARNAYPVAKVALGRWFHPCQTSASSRCDV